MIFRGKDRVWVSTDTDGNPVLKDGRATMKYRPDEGAKTYAATVTNLAARRSSPKNSKAAKPATAAKTSFDELVWKDPATEIFRSTQIPDELLDVEAPSAGIYEFFTDGACSGNPGPCGWGFVLRTANGYVEASQYLGIGTNNIAELMGIKAALEEVDDPQAKLFIHTDSNYALGVLTKDWKAKANTELIKTIRAQLRRYNTPPQIIKVKGHDGHPLNERADFLATSSLRS